MPSETVRQRGPLSSLYRRACRWDPIRLASQTATAAVVAYAIARGLGMQHISWTIISALFVIQASVGGTFGTAVHRIAGAGIGLAVGLACIFMIGVGGGRTVASLALSVGIMSFIAGIWPSLSYGLVTVGILVVAPGFDVVENALAKAMSIALGSVVGALASAFVLPLAAHRDADEHLGKALRCCGDLLVESMDSLLGKKAGDGRAVRDALEAALARARSMATQSQHLRIRARQPLPETTLQRVERLWYTLVLIERLSREPLPSGPREHLAERVEAATQTCCRYLLHLDRAIARGDRLDAPDEVRRRIEAITCALTELRRQRLLDGLGYRDAERVFSLAFAWQEISRNIDDLARQAANAQNPSRAGRGRLMKIIDGGLSAVREWRFHPSGPSER